MANQITRDIYVLSNKVKEPIDYVRFTNAIPIVFNFQDYEIPDGATANAYCTKPSGKAVYSPAVLSGNTVTINVSNQMFIELGITILQVEVVSGESTLVTFGWPVNVQPNGTEGDIPESQNESTFYDQMQQAISDADTAAGNANTAAQTADEAAQSANTAAQSANTAAENANQAAAGVEQTVQDAITQTAINEAVSQYFAQNPVSIATPELSGTTIIYTGSIDPSAQLEQDVSDLKTFAAQFNDKTLYTT